MKQPIPNETEYTQPNDFSLQVFILGNQENRMRLPIPAFYLLPGSLLEVRTVTGQSNSVNPPSLIYSMHSEYVYTLQSEQR